MKEILITVLIMSSSYSWSKNSVAFPSHNGSQAFDYFVIHAKVSREFGEPDMTGRSGSKFWNEINKYLARNCILQGGMDVSLYKANDNESYLVSQSVKCYK